MLYEGETKDWIGTAKFLPDEEGCQFILHMAHSAMLRIQFVQNTELKYVCIIMELAHSTDFSLLYHTWVQGTRYNDLLIMSGNGFGEILIWQPKDPIILDPTRLLKCYRLNLRVKAHNGVIFSINYKMSANLLVTTSDDRSLKFWKLDTKPLSVKPILSCFGHTARVYCAMIVDYEDQMLIISGGEDSFICIWNPEGKLLLKHRLQFGAPIWKLGFDAVNSMIYCTGATGNILGINIQTIFKQEQLHISQLSSTEYMRKVKYITKSVAIGLSNKNSLYHINVNTESAIWKLVSEFPAYKCSVLEVFDGMIATCGAERVTLLRFNADTGSFVKVYDGGIMESIVRSFHFLNKELYLISDEQGNCLLLKGDELQVVGRFNNAAGRDESCITAAVLILPQCILLSRRNGNLMLYTQEPDATEFVMRDKIRHLHGYMGSTVLQLLRIHGEHAHILSAGHGPALIYLRINLNDYQLSVLRREYVPLAWVEAAPTSDILIGFNDNHIVAWSRQHGVILQLKCGGGHRCWDFELTNEALDIIFVQKKEVIFYREQLYPESKRSLLPRNSWHTKSCNTMQLLLPKAANGKKYLLSAGEDNIIQINLVIDDSLFPRLELHTHLSNVKYLAAIAVLGTPGSWLIFSVGGRAQLCINEFDSVTGSVTELGSHTLLSITPNNNARLMSIVVLRQENTNGFSLYVASSDGRVLLYTWQLAKAAMLNFIRLIDVKRCPLQLKCLPELDLMIVATTSGELYGYNHTLDLQKFKLQLHSGGINVLDAFVEQQHTLHIVTGGDDENVKHTTIKLNDLQLEETIEHAKLHNAQVNALTIQSESAGLFVYTCGVDKQIYKIHLSTQQRTHLGYTCIADTKGMLLHENECLFVYGSGLQAIKLVEY
ncbi:CG33172 [Drosophila busckii]|uniref:tRNA (34-2'-O)-methyltransferase regulator WDR6 n=3 Tax=Drosophila busckii TaxID=30019 RepID=A0A0M4EZP1_DROBS|nr:CG33172 [Drosophila busckii]